ncbi:MAG: hypothetical protein J6Y91_05030 [Alphaproteobacteria bacterium]|nr:hypothetical protein [Alphaproteobacteria bacterium]
MLKKILHLFCVLISGVAWTAMLAGLLYFGFNALYGLDLFSKQTYQIFESFWNNGGVLTAKELLTLLVIILVLLLCLFGWKKMYNFKYMKLLTVPLNWFANRGFNDYQGMTAVNIKNLKVEEKKTIDQIVQERLEQERRKESNQSKERDFRSAIIEKIEQEKGEI